MKRTLGLGANDAWVAGAAAAIAFTIGGCGGGGGSAGGKKLTGIPSIDNAPSGGTTRVMSEGPPPVTDGLIAYFPLDDATGAPNVPALEKVSGMQAVYTGGQSGPKLSDPGPVNFTNPGSVHFSGADGQGLRVAEAPEALKVTGAVSISLWLRTTAMAGDMDLVSMGDNYGLRGSGSAAFFQRGNGTWLGCPGKVFVKDGLWHHAAAVKDGATVTVYVDGVPAADPCPNFPGIDYDQAPALWLGEHGNGQLFPYEGDLDDVRIYNRALTPAEITRLAGGA
jgi:hypothetical protein